MRTAIMLYRVPSGSKSPPIASVGFATDVPAGTRLDWRSRPAAVFIHPNDTVWDAGHTMRTSGAGQLVSPMNAISATPLAINYEAPLPFEAMKSPGKVSTVRG